jgi:hypothetical protein
MDESYSIQIDATDGELMPACEHIVREFIRGARHGFCEINVKVELRPSKKKCITVRAGKSQRFVI